ncbi:cell division protein ZipA [Shewanella sp. OMA3-2]|uniref:cell division protein ZipA n=1 Tax=Shewanella sp. OMA3-2 TaxID=2908650 RepID=UPI001F1C77FF|nr:cell division protein ZipA [Shewanella sp. OMA3-2]UJF23420.1 cell division protein ZipA [Shewanella sp. OMA3-2]
MEDLQLVLLVLGAIAIIAVLVHGFWSIRKQQPKSMKESPMANFYKEQADRRDLTGFDNDGIGSVRVRKSTEVDPPVLKSAFNKTSSVFKAAQDKVIKPVEMGLYKAAEKAQQQISTSQQSSIDKKQQPLNTANKDVDNRERNTKDLEEIKLPTYAESKEQLLQNKPDKQPVQPAVAEAAVDVVDTKPEQPLADPTDVLVLHLVAKPGELLQGAELLPALLSLNFKFGDMEIFHRHIDNAGTGKVLFSLANMVKPGVFDPDNMEQFVTEGVVLFMTLPCYGDPKMNFTIMLNSAMQLAEDLDAELLDGKRQPWNDAAKEDYKRRIAIA